MDRTILQSMYEAHCWANKVMLDGLETVDPELLHKEVPSSFPSLHATLLHMLGTERFLLATLRGEERERLNRDELQTLPAIRSAWAETEGRWRESLSALDEEALQRTVTLTFRPDASFQVKAWQVVNQLLVHTPYHRGQVVTMLRQLGAPTFQTDAIKYHVAQSIKR